jgi:hypothetical protein
MLTACAVPEKRPQINLGSGTQALSRQERAPERDVLASPAVSSQALPPIFLGATVKDHLGSPFRFDRAVCPEGMAEIGGRFCIDKYEATLVEAHDNGVEEPFPYFLSVDGHRVRAVSRAGVYPQGYISGKEAQTACKAAGKRLCKSTEWISACRGPQNTTYPYGDKHESKRCNDYGTSPRGQNKQSTDLQRAWEEMNDSRLNQMANTVAKTGDHEGCANEYGVYDMVGNLHEWVDDPAGTFRGGYYLDNVQNGEGCTYQTTAHVFAYHDYSTGFRCCKDIEL